MALDRCREDCTTGDDHPRLADVAGGTSVWGWYRYTGECAAGGCFTQCRGEHSEGDGLFGDSCDDPFGVSGSALASGGAVYARGDYGADIADDLLCVAHEAEWNAGREHWFGVGCGCEFDERWRSHANAWARGIVFDHTGPVAIRVKVTMERTSADANPAPYRGVVQFYAITVVWTFPDRTQEVVVYHGVAGLLDGASAPIVLGFLDSPDYGTTINGDTVTFSGDGTLALLPSSPDPLSSEVTVEAQSLARLGDLDGDGIVCSSDVDAMEILAAQAPTLGMDGYTARGDMDLDGDVDADDLTALLDLFASLPDCNANGVPDDCDILYGSSRDRNTNGIPDECEFDVTPQAVEQRQLSSEDPERI